MTAASTERAPAGHELMPHLAGVYQAALVLADNPDAAEKLVLDTFGIAFTALDGLAPGTDVTVWLYRILLGAFASRRGASMPEPGQAGAVHLRGRPHALRTARTGPADAADIERLPKSVFRAAMRALPVESRIVIYLADAVDFAYSEIAEATGVPAAEVAPRLHRARTELRELLTARVAR